MARRARSDSLAPGLIGALLLHAGVVGLVILFMPKTSTNPLGSAVEVTVVASMPSAPDAGPVTEETAPPAPQPETAPAAESPSPQQAQQPTPAAKPLATPAKGAGGTGHIDLDKLAAEADAHTRKAAPGPAHRATAPRVGAVAGPNPGGMGGLVDKMGRLWNIDCDIPGTRDAKPEISFMISTDGRIIRGPTLNNPSGDSVFASAADAAIRALKKGEPYSLAEVSMDNRNKMQTLRFRADLVCASR